jgi:hypothetical protein
VNGGTPPAFDEVTLLSFSTASTIPSNLPPPVQITVTDATKAQDAYQETLALPLAQLLTPQPGGHSCLDDWGVTYQLTFSLASGGTLTVVADPNGCRSVSIPGTCVRSADSAYWSQLAQDLGIPESEIYPYSPNIVQPPDAGAAACAKDADCPAGCTWQGKTISVGQQVDAGDGCNTCECMVAGMACTTRDCVSRDAATPVCSLPYALTFGSDGGKVSLRDSFTLDTAGRLTVTRNDFRSTDGPSARTCSPTLPVCGASGVVSISTVAQDLNDADVQTALGLTTSHVYGRDERPTDGSVWSITWASGENILVGSPCPEYMSSCQSIPAGIQRLADDLRSLAYTAEALPACAGL